MRIVSVVIAVYNRCDQLSRVLDGLLGQTTDGAFVYEVIVVDNNSKDATRQTVEAYIPRFSAVELSGKCVGLRYFFEPTQGKSYALNHGIKAAKGDFIFFTDDDVVIEKNWLKTMMDCFKQYNCDGVGGRVFPIYPDNTPAWIRQEDKNKMAGVVVTYDYGEGIKKFEPSMSEFIGANYAFKRQVFEECGNFRVEYSKGEVPVGEDHEFVRRLVKANKVLYYSGPSVVWHPVDLKRARLKNIARWGIALGRSAAQDEQERKDLHTYVYWFGIPRYLISGVVLDFLQIIPNMFNKRALFHSLRRYYRKVGMIMEYRESISKKVVEGEMSCLK